MNEKAGPLVKLRQKIKCSVPFNLHWIGHELKVIQEMRPTGSWIAQCIHCGRLFGMNHNVKLLLPLSREMAEMYIFMGNKLEHVESKYCWCNPVLAYEDSENGNQVWVHNDITYESLYEQAREKPKKCWEEDDRCNDCPVDYSNKECPEYRRG